MYFPRRGWQKNCQNCKIPKCSDLRLSNGFTYVHMQVRCKKHPRCIQTRRRPLLKAPRPENWREKKRHETYKNELVPKKQLGIRLTVQIKQHFGVPKLYYWFDGENVFATKEVQKNDLGLTFGVPGSDCRCASFSFRRVFRFCEDLVPVRVYQLLLVQNELSQDRLG